MERAIALAAQNARSGAGGPFGAVIVRRGRLLAEGVNSVTHTNDPTAHAEIVAIREACRKSGHFELTDCELYTSCEPCPMCLGAIYWARLGRIYYACDRADAAAAGFDDSFIYDEIGFPLGGRSIPARQLLRRQGQAAFRAWAETPDKIPY